MKPVVTNFWITKAVLSILLVSLSMPSFATWEPVVIENGIKYVRINRQEGGLEIYQCYLADYVGDDYATVENIVIPDHVTFTGYDEGFQGENWYNPHMVTWIGDGSSIFQKCPNLKTITLPAYAHEIKKGAFLGCYKLENVYGGAGLRTIGEQAFASCISLKHIDGMEFLHEIGKLAFFNCNQLTSYGPYPALKYIDEGAFRQCSAIETIHIVPATSVIEEKAFADCNNLKYIHFETSEDTLLIYNNSFDLSTSIDERYLYSNRPFLCSNTDLSDCKFTYVQYGGYSIEPFRYFQGNPTLQYFIATDAPGIDQIQPRAFMNCPKLIKVKLPESVKTIGYEAFENCEELSEVQIPGVITIDQVAFKNCKKINNITIPYTTEIINPRAFEGCEGLVEVNDLSGIKEIRNQAFAGCKVLRNISFSSRLTYIGDSAFYGNDILKVNIPASVEDIGNHAFAYNGWLQSITFENGNKALTIGDEAFIKHEDDKLVKLYCFRPLSVASTAFRKSNLQKVVLGDEVSSIPGFCFKGCYKLTTLDLDDALHLTAIGESAFEGTGLTSISIPNSVTSIDSQAFAYCDRLTDITIEGGAKPLTLGPCVFMRSLHISDPIVLNFNRPIAASTYSTTTFNYSQITQATIGSYVKEIPKYWFFYVPELEVLDLSNANDLETISPEAFRKCALTSLVIPSSVTSIGSYSFYECSQLATVEINGSPEIGEHAFPDNTQLIQAKISYEDWLSSYPAKRWQVDELYIPNDNVANYQGYSTDYNLSTEFPYVTKVTFGPKVTKVGKACFLNRDEWFNLQTVTFESTPDIGNYAFSGNANLKTIEGKIGNVGNEAFWGCTSLTTIPLSEATQTIGNHAFTQCSELKELTLPSSLLSIGQQAFISCDKLTSVKIPEGVTTIGKNAFQCENLTKVTIDSEVLLNPTEEGWTESNNLAKIFPYAEEVELGSKITTIGDNAFCGSTALKSINLDNITALGYASFMNCTALESVVIPESIKDLKLSTFEGCTNLATVQIDSRALLYPYSRNWDDPNFDGENPTYLDWTIQNNLAKRFKYMKELYLGNSQTFFEQIGKYAFYGSEHLESVHLMGTTVRIDSTAFLHSPKLNNLYIEADLYHMCTANDNMSHRFPNLTYLYIGKEIHKAQYQYIFCVNDGSSYPLKTVQIEGGFYGAMYGFYGCKNLAKISLGNQCYDIDDYTFAKCEKLKKITLPESVSSIRYNAFRDCTSLTTITLPSYLWQICDSAFVNCGALTNIINMKEQPLELTEAQAIFQGVDAASVTLRVPSDSYEEYSRSDVWKDFMLSDFGAENMELLDGEEYDLAEDTDQYPLVRYTRNFSPEVVNKWQCLYVPFAFTVSSALLDEFDFAQLYMISHKDDDNDGYISETDPLAMVISKLGNADVIDANKPYFIRAKSSGTKHIDVEGTTLKAAESTTIDCATTWEQFTITGVYQQTPMAGRYGISTNGTFTYITNAATELKPFRWYMTMESRDGEQIANQAPIRIITLGEDDTTGIFGITAAKSADWADSIYTLDGLKVSNTDQLPHGLYIINGKKVMK